MTDKRFVIKPSAIVTDGFVIIDKEKKYTFPVLDSTLNYMFCKALNELHEENQSLKFQLDECQNHKLYSRRELEKENEQLKQENSELKLDNDIKFWKHQFMMSYNTSQIIMHEISRAIDDGYEVSEEFQKYLNELKVQNNENKEKMERLGI